MGDSAVRQRKNVPNKSGGKASVASSGIKEILSDPDKLKEKLAREKLIGQARTGVRLLP